MPAARTQTRLAQEQNNHGRRSRQMDEALAERRRTIANGLLAGLTHTEMARALEINPAVLTREVKVIRAQWRKEQDGTYQEYVDKELMRIDRLIAALWQLAIQRADERKVLAIASLIDRRVKILGLDAPERHKVEISHDTTVEEIADKLTALAASYCEDGEIVGEGGAGE